MCIYTLIELIDRWMDGLTDNIVCTLQGEFFSQHYAHLFL